MISEHLKAIFSKKQEEITDNDKAQVQEALKAYLADVKETNDRHGFHYVAKLSYAENGLIPFIIPEPLREPSAPEASE